MFLINYLKNTIRAKKFGAIIYLIVCAAINVTLFWLIYEKLFKQPHGIIIGICFYIVATFIFSSPLANVINKILFEGDFKKDGYTCPKAYRLFESIIVDYIAAGKTKANNIKLAIYDKKYLADTTAVMCFGNSQVYVNELADELPQEINIGRFALGIEATLYGYGEPAAVVLSANTFYLFLFMLLCLVRRFCNRLSRSMGLKFLADIAEFENNILYTILGFPIQIGNKICSLKYDDSFFAEVSKSPYYNEIQEYLNIIE